MNYVKNHSLKLGINVGNHLKFTALNEEKAQILLYGFIGTNELLNASSFVSNLNKVAGEYRNIDVRINSGGGSVFEGIAMYHALRDCKANIETYIDGLAGSMASILALGGTVVHMNKHAKIMTHKPSADAQGTSDVLRKSALLLEEIEDSMSEIYAAKTGKTKEKSREIFMNGSDRWWNAGDAMSVGLIDKIFETDPVKRPAMSINEKAAYEEYQMQLEEIQTPVITSTNNDYNPVDIIKGLKNNETAQLMALDKRELFMNGGWDRLKEIAPDAFKVKWKEEYGTDYKGLM